MEIEISRVHFDADELEVKKALAQVLHSPQYEAIHATFKLKPRDGEESIGLQQQQLPRQDVPVSSRSHLLNFRVMLRPSEKIGYTNNGFGVLILPTEEAGLAFLKLINPDAGGSGSKSGSSNGNYDDHGAATNNNNNNNNNNIDNDNNVSKKTTTITVRGHKLRFRRSKKSAAEDVLEILNKVTFQDPDTEAAREALKLELDELRLLLRSISFGIIPLSDPATFSQEWERDFHANANTTWPGELTMEWEHKLFRVMSKMKGKWEKEIIQSVVVRFADIHKIYKGSWLFNPYIIFEMHSPPVFEEEFTYRPTTSGRGNHYDRNKFRKRIGSLEPAHAVVAPYVQHICVVLSNEADVDKFIHACDKATLTRPRCRRFFLESRAFFHRTLLDKINAWHRTVNSWPVTFQVEALLRNGILNTKEVIELLPKFRAYFDKNGTEASVALLRAFNSHISKLPRDLKRSPSTEFDTLETANANSAHLLQSRTNGYHMCYHVTITPTRMLFEGPYPDQGNPVVNQYDSEYFIRVSFKDEDGLTYRWDGVVDGEPFLRRRVGGILKAGFEVAHYHFDFLAFSSSGLRSHSVWFMRQFRLRVAAPTGANGGANGVVLLDKSFKKQQIRDCVSPSSSFQWVTMTVDKIRESLGDFTKIADQPSKVAARMGQRFTASRRSIFISKQEWMDRQLHDIGVVKSRATVITDPDNYSGHTFTDGNGTMSPELARLIHEELWDYQSRAKTVEAPSVYQIRFLGFKGVIACDESLEGKQLRLRPSMNKFKAHEQEGNLEIAGVFYKPGRMHLNRQYIMILEDLGIHTNNFLKLQEDAVARINMIKTSMGDLSKFLFTHRLGNAFFLSSIVDRLAKNGMTIGDGRDDDDPDTAKKRIFFPFFQRLVGYSATHALREVKYKARIPVPESYQLVGVADEGMEWIARGVKNVHLLEEKEIYACIQERGREPQWLEGLCLISRSPTVHPGDVQLVTAIGKPPAGMACSFANLKNCVVFNTRGKRPLPSCLGGGDLDGDLYDICMYKPLIPEVSVDAAEYPTVPAKRLSDFDDSESESDSDSEEYEYHHEDEAEEHDIEVIPKPARTQCDINDIAKFVVEYIYSDVVGLLSVNHSVIADQSKYGVFDNRCKKIAQLCSQAVDYPKSGWRVPMSECPRRLIPYNPDWREGEEESTYKVFYKSERAVGHLFRAITLEKPEEVMRMATNSRSTGPPVLSMLVESIVGAHYNIPAKKQPEYSDDVKETYKFYVQEMRVIAATHTLKRDPMARLTEEEITLGTILGSSSDHRMRQDRIQRLKEHTTDLVKDVKFLLVGSMEEGEMNRPEDMRKKLQMAWQAWMLGACKGREFGGSSFALIALGLIFELVGKIEETTTTTTTTSHDSG